MVIYRRSRLRGVDTNYHVVLPSPKLPILAFLGKKGRDHVAKDTTATDCRFCGSDDPVGFGGCSREFHSGIVGDWRHIQLHGGWLLHVLAQRIIPVYIFLLSAGGHHPGIESLHLCCGLLRKL